MDSSEVFLAKSIVQAIIHDIDLENPLHGGKAFAKFLRERLPVGLTNYAVGLLSRHQLLWRIQHLEEGTTRFLPVMHI